jgi:hypothetical protein
MAGVGSDLDEKINREQQERANPVSSDLYKQEQAGYDREFNDMANNFGQTADGGQENDNINKLRDAEETAPESGFYRPGGSKQQKASGKAFLKKKGPMAAIITILLGGGTGLSFLFSPGIAVVQLKETLTKDLNDQVAALDIRSSHVFRAKLKGLQADASICSSAINIRCKFSTMSGTSTKNFRKANIQLECDGGKSCSENLLSRNKVTKITFPDGKSFTNPAEATRYARSNTGAASAMRKAYNPLFHGLSDAPAMKALGRLGISKRSILTGDTEENNKRLKEAVRSGVSADGSLASETSNSNDDKETQSKKDLANQLTQELDEGTKGVVESGQKAGSKLLSGTVKSVGILGVVDNACTVYRTGLAIEAGAKVIRATQLARYAMTFLTVADAIKAGDATPEQVEYVGNILTMTDNRKTISIPDPTDKHKIKTIDNVANPAYGKSAFDSAGYKLAAYNEASRLSSISQQYTVGGTGGLLGILTGTNAILQGFNPQTTCGVVQNGFVRVGSLIVGVFAGALSGGSTIAYTIGANIAVNIALSFAEQMLIDLLAGTVVDDSTTGSQAGDAIFVGSSVIMGNVAAAHGLSPLTLDGIKNYTVAKAGVDERYIAMDKYDAKEQPYNINNKYTFIGSLAYSLNDTYRTAGGNVLSTLGSLASAPLKLSTAHASQTTFNPERYEQCDDPTYKRLGLAPDVFCNLRYGLSDHELAMDTSQVVDYMISKGHIDEMTGDPKSTEFRDYVKYCIDRTNPIGNSGDQEDGDTSKSEGEICYSQEGEYQYFRVYLVDKSISDSIDEEPLPSEVSPTPGVTNGSLENSGNITEGGWSFPTTAGAPITGTRFIAPSGSNYGHPGLDIGLKGPNVPIYAVRDGVVASAGDITSSGYRQPCAGTGIQQVVVLRHDFDRQTYFSSYHHVAQGSITVRPGQTVKAGDRIATMGSTGCSTAQHLHFEIWRDQIIRGTAIDPTPIFYN